PAVAAALAAQAEQSFPGIGIWPWTAQAGVRAAATDGLPLVGRSVSGAFICAGARRNGWLIAPLAAQLIADLVLDRAPGSWARTLDPRRFAA
ncbi:MAG TPA: FAD-dependent oxidoreductase, partial [Phenylobacterium sp.]|nr:FAD-dependent oxidoreductase [Phenylobacterium sp.]